MRCREYVDKSIKESTPYIDAKSFIDGTKPLKKMWMVLFVVVAIATVVNIGIGILLLILSVAIVPTVVAAIFIFKENVKIYSFDNSKKIDLDELCEYLKNNLEGLPFSEWRRGNASTIVGAVESLEIIECCFKNKTYHRIVFDKSLNGEYKIVASHVATKERVKRMSHGGVLMYKNHYVVLPILKAAFDFYIANKDGVEVQL